MSLVLAPEMGKVACVSYSSCLQGYAWCLPVETAAADAPQCAPYMHPYKSAPCDLFKECATRCEGGSHF